MNEKHVITQGGDIIAIVESQMLADHFAKFLPDTKVFPFSHYDFSYNDIRKFMGEK